MQVLRLYNLKRKLKQINKLNNSLIKGILKNIFAWNSFQTSLTNKVIIVNYIKHLKMKKVIMKVNLNK